MSTLGAQVLAGTGASFGLAMTSPAVSIASGDSAIVALEITAAPGYSQPIYLTAGGLPAGVSVDFPSPIVGGQTVSLTINTSLSSSVKAFPFTLYASSSAENHSATLSLTVTPPVTSHWVGAWGASASSPSNGGDKYYLTNVTVRQIAHLSIGTSANLRLRLSNALGSAPVSFASVHVAQWAGSGSSVTNAIVPKTDHTVTFDGAESVTIQPGSEVFSDPVVFPLPADSDLAVSFYIPRTSNIPATMHTFGNQTSYFALGNFAASITLPNALKDTVRPYLTGVDVDSTAASSLVVLGDSITDGTRSSANQNLRWTDDLARRLTSTFGDRVGVVNAGIAGNCVIGACLGPSMTDRFQRDVLSISGVKYLIILAGINDLVNTPGITAAMLAKAYNNLISQAHAQGILVYGATLTPFGGSKFFTQAREQLRQQVNTFIRAGGAFDAVIDFDKVIANPVNLAYIQPQFNADNVHPNDAGYQAMANAIDVTLLTRIPSLAGR